MDTRQVLVLARVVSDIPRANVHFDGRGEQPRADHRVFLWIILDNYHVYGLDPKGGKEGSLKSSVEAASHL